MSEISDNNLIKKSLNPEVQQQVETQKDLIRKMSPQMDEKTVNTFARTVVSKNLRLDRKTEELKKAKEEVGIDSLTGLHNYKWFNEQLQLKIAEANRNQKAFKIVKFDIDFFKNVNDTYGHDAGDEILKSVSRIRGRTEEPICRVGGEEFMLILDAQNTSDIEILTTRIMEDMENLSSVTLQDKKPLPNIANPKILKKTTLSMGVAEYIPGISKENLLKTADNALYQAKQTGRNKAVYATKLPQGDYDYKELQRKEPVAKNVIQ